MFPEEGGAKAALTSRAAAAVEMLLVRSHRPKRLSRPPPVLPRGSRHPGGTVQHGKWG